MRHVDGDGGGGHGACGPNKWAMRVYSLLLLYTVVVLWWLLRTTVICYCVYIYVNFPVQLY